MKQTNETTLHLHSNRVISTIKTILNIIINHIKINSTSYLRKLLTHNAFHVISELTSSVPPDLACITIFKRAKAEILICLKKCGLKERKRDKYINKTIPTLILR